MTVQDIDVRMIQRAARGDSDAFATLFDHHYEHVYRYALWLCGDAHAAEDIAQETFIRAHRGLSSLGPPYNIRAWLFRLAHNYFIDTTRRVGPEVPLDPDAPIPTNLPNPEWQLTFSELSTGVVMALGRLPTNQREVLMLREVEGLQYADIAQVTGLSLDNVKVALHRARSTFKDHYATRLVAEDPRPRCDVLGDLLDSFADGEHLTPDEELLVRAHIKQCDTCQQRKREIAAIALLLRGLQWPRPMGRARDRLMRRINRPRRLVRIAVLGVVAVMALVLGGGMVLAGGLPDTEDLLDMLDRSGVESAPTAEAVSTEPPRDTPTPRETATEPGTGPAVAPPLPTDATNHVETVAVWACEYIGNDTFQWYEALVTYQDGVPISSEILSGPYQGGWQPNCPPAPTPTDQPDPCEKSCGNQVCEPVCGESANNCPADCP